MESLKKTQKSVEMIVLPHGRRQLVWRDLVSTVTYTSFPLTLESKSKAKQREMTSGAHTAGFWAAGGGGGEWRP